MARTRSAVGRIRTIALPAVAAAGLLTASLAGAFSAPAVAETMPVTDACEGAEGVTVVVDFTDLGGEIETGCAEGDPANGREALEAAGFTPADSQPGMICTINSLPDPCPEEFDGNYWSYWNAESGGEWTSYQVGADESDPAPGTFEGWRYFDGSEAPGATPEELADQTATEENGEGSAATDDAPEEGANDDDGAGPLVPILIGVAAVVLIGAIVLVLRRRAKG
ncbi:hypothetical protein [Ruania halotolerans]|uniref:hypothetical protein n=1 Tax=Ruania halotolerans TaxID=2897773 RepID=UPI001E5B3500|nr:hypothetical protein [Ruania halotolerans]UFU07708.1 hypothetical protein LQF10_06310 [Ruania halotolerans]